MVENSPLQLNDAEVSSERIFDLYLFVNPIGETCYHCEKELLKFIDQTTYKVYLHFVTFHNFSNVTQYMRRLKLNEKNLQLRNEIYTTIYKASVTYKAALLQGKRLGKKFLITLQKKIHVENRPFNDELLAEIIDEIGLDKEMFFEDVHSDLVRESYALDQAIAQEMNVSISPSLVIFDSFNQDYGIMVEGNISSQTIYDFVTHMDQYPTCECNPSNPDGTCSSQINNITYLKKKL